jgi:starch-binding outer membrane protein, SusD/RagB family
MKKYKSIYTLLFGALCLGTIACKKQLDVGNPNAPTLGGNVNTEAGLISFSQGGVYINGFSNGDGWLGDSYFSLPWGYSELMADNVGADASNNQITTIGVPDYIIVSGVTTTNPSPSIGILRSYNNRASTGANNNPIYYQWLNMYALNYACNKTLSLVDGITFSGDATSKINTVKAWCYWWKGYAYASIGSMYYSGLILNEADVPSSDYVSHDAIIDESNKYFNMAATTLGTITSVNDYEDILGKLIPAFCQVGNGGVLTKDMWIRNINTMLARNILVNKLSPFVNSNLNATITKSSTSNMTTADWNSVLTLATNGVKVGDYIFTGRSPAINNFFSANGGTASALTAAVNTSSTFKISERFIQYFKPADQRLANNFYQDPTYKNSYVYTTRWNMTDGGNGMAGVYVYGSHASDDYEVIIAGSYEENALMLAEANIRLNSTEAGLAYVDAVRAYLGAGLPAVTGTGLTQTQAMKELVAERRVALIYKGLSFYDNRRWGWTYDISNGGGSYDNILVSSDGVIHNGVTFNYNFLDYWDVPADESVLNPPSASSVAVKNPNF